jgi:serine/threonine-protein kinase
MPAAGSTSTPGSEIFVVVSKGVGVVEVPDITGLPPEKAAKLLRTYHLRLGRQIDSEYSDKLPKNYILRQSPAAGEKVAKGSALDYWLSEGPKPVEPPPPALNGLPPAVVPVPLEPGDNSGTATPDRIVVPSTGPDTATPAPATPEPDGNSSPSENPAPAGPKKSDASMPESPGTAQ